MKKTIFSRSYDREKELEVPEGAPKPELDSFEEFWRKCQEAVVVPVPARLEGAKEFIRKIMEFSALFSYDYIEYFKVTAPDNKVLFTEKDISFVSHMSLDGKQYIEAEIENSSFEVLRKAYKENIGKTFTVFYGSEKLYTFKFPSEPKDCLFYIENVISDEDFQSLAINLKRINKKSQYS